MSETEEDWKVKARRLRDDGWSYVKIAPIVGRSPSAVARALDLELRQRCRAANSSRVRKAIAFNQISPPKRKPPPTKRLSRPKAGERQPHIDAAVQAFLKGEISRAELAHRLRAPSL